MVTVAGEDEHGRMPGSRLFECSPVARGQILEPFNDQTESVIGVFGKTSL